jgi:hypothetical protein
MERINEERISIWIPTPQFVSKIGDVGIYVPGDGDTRYPDYRTGRAVIGIEACKWQNTDPKNTYCCNVCPGYVNGNCFGWGNEYRLFLAQQSQTRFSEEMEKTIDREVKMIKGGAL